MTPQEILKKLNENHPGYDFKLETYDGKNEYGTKYGFISEKGGRFGGGLRENYDDEDADILILHAGLFIKERKI